MNIGIVAYRQNPYISANTAIAYTLAEEFKRQGIHVVHIGRLQDKEQKEIRDYNGISICYLNKTPKPKWTKAENYLMRAGLYKLALWEDIRALRAIVREQELDAILCISAPNENAMIVGKAGLHIPCLLFQLDPFYNNSDKEDPRMKRVFQRLLPAFQYTFTTDLLMHGYCQDPEMEEYLKKIGVAQFPKLMQRSVLASIEKDINHTRLLYAGSLYKQVRDPHILSNLKRCLPKEIEVVFCGSCDKEDESDLAESGVICKGYCTQEALAKETAAADILINIGNTVMNQFGSKLIDYIATGKPILNIIQIPECPTQRVLEYYDNKLTVTAKEINDRWEEIATFIHTAKGHTIPWEIIRSAYYSYTPEYVAKQITVKVKSR